MSGDANLRYAPLKHDGACYAFGSFCDDGNADALAHTACLLPNEPLGFERVPSFIKLTIFGFDATERRVVPIGTSFLAVRDSGDNRVAVFGGKFEIVVRGCLVVDVTDDVGDSIDEHQRHCSAYFDSRLREMKAMPTAVSRPYVHTYMLECEVPLKWRVPCIGGWPQMDSLSAMPTREVVDGFERCVHVAKAITGFDAQLARSCSTEGVTTHRILENLFVSAMRVYAGVYPDGVENIDDRSLGCLKLCTNSDCDDMSITVAAFFNRLKRGDCVPLVKSDDAFGPHAVLSHALSAFEEVWCVQGLVQTSVAVPRPMNWLWKRKTSGHVWCMLKRTDGAFSHLECTRCVAVGPRSGDGDCVETGGCFREHSSSQRMECGLAECDVSRYTMACAAYTVNSMILPISRTSGMRSDAVGVDYADLLSGACRTAMVLTPRSSIARPPAGGHVWLIDKLRHRPTHAHLAKAVRHAPHAFALAHISSKADHDARAGVQTVVYGGPSAKAVCSWNVSPCVTWAGHLAVDE